MTYRLNMKALFALGYLELNFGCPQTGPLKQGVYMIGLRGVVQSLYTKQCTLLMMFVENFGLNALSFSLILHVNSLQYNSNRKM